MLLTNLSETFDCLSYEIIIAKLNAYGFLLSALKLISNYLTDRKERTKINNLYNSWEDILFGVPQGSILGPIFLNIFLSDLFLVIDDIDLADMPMITPFSDDSIDDVILSLEDSAKEVFQFNRKKRNTDKCQLLLSKNNESQLEAGDFLIKNSIKIAPLRNFWLVRLTVN